MKHMVVYSARTTHRKSGSPTWRVISRVGDCCDDARRPNLEPLFTKRHCQLRLRWAREHRDKMVDKWKIFASDESTVVFHHVDGCTDHLIGTSAHTPPRPMVTYTGMGTVGPSPHGL
ncbi:hypothetical protein TNCV_2674211 [Trichonephila clavipes]|nr:hypothetical protein TNCV_2674211 [Trichonephila clavipes]